MYDVKFLFKVDTCDARVTLSTGYLPSWRSMEVLSSSHYWRTFDRREQKEEECSQKRCSGQKFRQKFTFGSSYKHKRLRLIRKNAEALSTFGNGTKTMSRKSNLKQALPTYKHQRT